MSNEEKKHQFFSYDSSQWSTGEFALEVQQPWSRLLLEQKKTVEARSYPLPDGLLGRRIYLLESHAQGSLQSSLANNFQTNSIIGSVVFSKVIEYNSQDEFQSDEESHLVSRDSPFGWTLGTERMYGWIVQNIHLTKEMESVWVERRMRSLFEIIR